MTQQSIADRFPGFPRNFEGTLFQPGSDGYGKARSIYNMLRSDEDPTLIARVANAEDVARVMRYASEKGVPVAVRSGGHGVDGSAMPGGQLVVDLSQLKRLKVDAGTRACRVESGVLLGELDAATQVHGLVVPSGTVTSTGVAGLTLGGGVGFNMRRFGATVDSLVACDMVTVDGRHVRASADENADLFWALRGGGGNFGVVTAFEFRAHGIGNDVISGAIVFPYDQAAGVLGKLREYIVDAPRELAVIAAATACPPLPPIPADAHHQPALMLVVVYTGAPERAPALVEALASMGRPLANLVGPSKWVETNSMFDAVAPYGRRVQTRGGYLGNLSDGAISAVLKNLKDSPRPTSPAPTSVQNLWCMGGAISEDAAEGDMAFSREGATWFWEAVGQWDGAEHDATYTAWADQAIADIKPFLLANGYCNLTSDLGPEWLRGLYGPAWKYERLLHTKRAWDPANLLRFNKNFNPNA